MRYSIKIIWADGSEEYLKEGLRDTGCPAVFDDRSDAENHKDFILQGLDEEEYQSVNVVPEPSAL